MKCIDCGAPFGHEHKRIMLTQEAVVLGKKVEWKICVQCYVRKEFPKREAVN